jgi:hypothetical protein
MVKKSYFFIPSLGMVSDINIKEILQIISKYRLGYYRKYLLQFFKLNNEKSILNFKKNLQNKNVSQIENVIKKSLFQSKIDFVPKVAPAPKQKRDLKKNLIAVKKYRSIKENKKSFSILMTDQTKKALLEVKTQNNFRTMEDLMLYFIKNTPKNDFNHFFE